jgi:putative tricarboxylic transport membrane protein
MAIPIVLGKPRLTIGAGQRRPATGQLRISEEFNVRTMVKSPQDLAAGLFLIVVAVVAWLVALPLPFSQVGGVGSGMLPKAVSAILGLLGVLITVGAFMSEGDRLTRWSLREIGLVLGAIMVFALTIRGFQIPGLGLSVPALGLAVAGPLTILISAQADRATRFLEALIFAVVLTAACIVLFRLLLRLPIPVFPPLLGY